MAPQAGAWLLALPITACGLRLDDETFRVAVGLRLGANICAPHRCPCGQQVSALGRHGLSCPRGFGRQARHGGTNDIIYRALNKAGYPSIKEPSGLSRSDGKRPDGMTLIPWRSGRSLLWDSTIVDTLAASYLLDTSVAAGAAAEIAATRKRSKYLELSNTYEFVPLALETLGPINAAGTDFIRLLGRNLTLVSGDPRETTYLFQRLSANIQRFNAVAFKGTFPNIAHDSATIPEY